MNLNLRSETAAGIVAGAAFLASAGHIVTVVDATNPIVFALAYPIGIDGLIFVGIRAVQAGRRAWGMTALLIGAFYSLAFNAHAEKALIMPALLIASSMPVCMFAAFLIEATAKKAEKIEVAAPVPAAAPVALPVPAAPVALPAIRWVGAGARWTLPIVPAAAPAPIKAKASVTRKPRTVAAPAAAAAITDGSTTAGRAAAWDVEKAVRLLADGRTNEDVAEAVGTNAKAIQRTKRAANLINGDASLTDENVSDMMNRSVSASHVGRVRAAMVKG